MPPPPCQRDRKAESTEILLTLPYLRALGFARRSKSAPGTRRGRGAPEPTVGADAERPKRAAGAPAHTVYPNLLKQQRWALGSPRVGANAPRPRFHFFRNELLDSLIS